MDFTDETMTLMEMLERNAERDHRLSQQRDLTSELRMLLDVADDDIATLRSENTSLIKQVKALEKILKEGLKVQAEPSEDVLAIDLAVKRCSEKKIRELENETSVMKKQNKKLIEELKSLQKERDDNKISLSNFRAALQTLEREMEEAQLGLQDRDEVINKKNLLLMHMEETVQEFCSTVELLRLTNQELKEKLEDKLVDASITAVNDLMGDEKALLSPPLSFAEEVKLLASLDEVRTHVSDSTDHVETEAEGLTKPGSVSLDVQTKTERQLTPKDTFLVPYVPLAHRRPSGFSAFLRAAGVLLAAVPRAGLFLASGVALSLLAFVVSGSCTGNLFSIDALWNTASLTLQPYCSVQYGALPPV
uniref:myosin-10-like n=1 Tax=Gasterosteus aculeatus aculeatus TaxID=481459 RepID=UPI001A990F1C|nr:myosin-10-like [Gasterosteus aculeatus aculeatus]